MSRVGILSFSDGRDFVHSGIADFIDEAEDRLAAACAELGHEVIRGQQAITSSPAAASEARRLAAARPDLTIFHYPVWAFPHFSMHAASATAGPLLLLGNIDPKYPGMVGMLAAGGSLDQIGRWHERLWGDVGQADVRESLNALASAARAVRALEGATFGRIGGRSMGMYTAVGRTDEWMRRFGIDVEEIDQWE
ncbi:MAG TPA: fucose isomerase, partial [Trebonia sp.]